MTRENKLALVVGFGLILFVGILISDHFSTVRSQRAADMTGHGAVDPLAMKHDPEGYIDLNKIDAPAPSPDPAPNATALGNSPPHPEAPPSTDAQPKGELALTPGVIPTGEATSKTAMTPDEKTPDGFVKVPTEGTPIPVNNRQHEIHAGDSLYAICKQYYGDTALLAAFAKFNSISDPTNLKVGTKLQIPPAEVIGGKVATTNSSKSESAPAPPTLDPNVHVKIEKTVNLPMKGSKPGPAATPPASPAPRVTYVVKAGDSLRQIALRFYGSKENWKKLRDLNKDVIDDPDNLKVGTVLKI